MTTGATGPTGPAITTFYVKYRVTHPVEIVTVEADSREGAMQQILNNADEGDQVEILQCQDFPYVGGPTGATGVSGPTGISGAAARHAAHDTHDTHAAKK